MTAIIDVRSEVLIDRSQVRNPYLRLLLSVVGQKLAKGSPWVVVDKRTFSKYEGLLPVSRRHQPSAA
jgi:hypothetical protein